MSNILQETVNVNDYFENEEIYGVIYKITNLITRKIYIGQTTKSIEHRWRGHIKWLKSGKRMQYIHKSMKKYGIENFKIEQIDEAYSLDELNQKEYDWINKENCIAPNGYNLVAGGNYPGYSNETREKLSIINKNKFSIYDPTTNEIMYIQKSEEIPEGYLKGRPKGVWHHSEETKQLFKERRNNEKWIYNPKTNERHIINKEEALPEDFTAGSGVNTILDKKFIYNKELDVLTIISKEEDLPNGFIYGVRPRNPVSEITCKKISDANKGVKKSKEHREKLSKSLFGRKIGKWFYNPETGLKKRIKEGCEIPSGFIPGKPENVTDELRLIRSENTKNRKWFNNPETSEEKLLKVTDFIPEGFKLGRLHSKKRNK